jgi:hypothetical protein
MFLHAVQALFALLGLGLFAAFAGSKQIGLLLAAVAFSGSTIASFQMMAWWPLAVGLAGAFALRLLGFEPGSDG